MKRTLAILAAMAAIGAQAQTVFICTRTEVGDGSFRLDCAPQQAPAPGPPAVPTVPTVPTMPTEPTPPTPPAAGQPPCPPNINPMICSMLGYGQAPAPSQPAQPAQPASGGESYYDPTFSFRCGSARRIYGDSGSKSVTATRAANVMFAVGESGGNETQQWHVTTLRNGAPIADADFVGVYYQSPVIAANAGDVLEVVVRSREPGKRISVVIRLSVDGC